MAAGDSVSNLDYSGGRKTHRFPPPYGLGSHSLTHRPTENPTGVTLFFLFCHSGLRAGDLPQVREGAFCHSEVVYNSMSTSVCFCVLLCYYCSGVYMTNINFTVDADKCIHCGLCEKDCISQIIKLNADKIPQILPQDENSCLKCQHCLAICPAGAISILDKQPENSVSCDNLPQSDSLLNLIQSRRSCRNYKHENLSPELIQKLKEMLIFPPTGCNNHNLHFAIIDDVDVMDRFRNRTNNKLKKLLVNGGNKLISRKFDRYKKAIINGEDVIYRNAPHLIVVSSPISAPCANEDGIIALSYFELYAQTLGIGTCWCGFAQMCIKLFPDLCEFLEIPDGYKPVYAMLFGPADIKYSRTVQPDEYKMTTVKGDKNVDNIPLIRKLKRLLWNSLR